MTKATNWATVLGSALGLAACATRRVSGVTPSPEKVMLPRSFDAEVSLAAVAVTVTVPLLSPPWGEIVKPSPLMVAVHAMFAVTVTVAVAPDVEASTRLSSGEMLSEAPEATNAATSEGLVGMTCMFLKFCSAVPSRAPVLSAIVIAAKPAASVAVAI